MDSIDEIRALIAAGKPLTDEQTFRYVQSRVDCTRHFPGRAITLICLQTPEEAEAMAARLREVSPAGYTFAAAGREVNATYNGDSPVA